MTILICPHCGTRYEVGPAKGTLGILRCRRCQGKFRADRGAGGNGHPGEGEGDGPPALPAGAALVAAEPGPFRDLLCRRLRDHGVPVKVTADGEQAFAVFRNSPPRYLFASVYLRRMLGITLCERIRGMRGPAGETRLALVGNALKRDPSEPGPEALYGADLYLVEGLPEGDLERKLREFLSGGEPETRAAERPAEEEREEPPEAAAGDPEQEIRKLGRIAADDLLLYHPSKVASCLDSDGVEETFREEIGQGKVLVQERYPNVPNAGEIFFHSLVENLMRTAAGKGL